MNDHLRILIVEDDAIIGESIHMHLMSLGHLPYEPLDNVAEALKFSDEHPVDLAFLDIRLNDKKSGVDLAKLWDQKQAFPYIYLTAYTDDQTLNEVKKTEPSGFLVKPFRRNELKAAVAVASAVSKATPEKKDTAAHEPPKDHIFVNVGGKWDRINIADILYLTSAHVYTEIHTSEGKKVTRTPLGKLVEQLNDHGIARVHRSSAVNLAHVHHFNRQIVRIGDVDFNISASYKTDLLKRLQAK
jgi:DNA-binding LytR/AlgR family response regulator